MKLADVKVGGVFDGPLMVESFQTGKTGKGKLYANFNLKDTDQNTIKAVFWDYKETDGEFIQPGKVIKLIGARVGEYNGTKQITVESYMPSDIPVTEFMRTTRFRISELEDQIDRTIESFEDGQIKALAKALLSGPVRDDFIKAPAATGVHNNWTGGLIEHVCSMLSLAEPIIAHYAKNYAPYFKRDHLLFGIIFHDLGKIMEYDVNNPAFERTVAGHYVNHIVMGPAWIYRKGFELGVSGKTIMELMHLVSSHHGCYEWGSPTKPVTLEAILLHHIDNMDSKFMHAWDLMENTAECSGGLTKKSWVEGTKYISQKEAYDAKRRKEVDGGNGSCRISPSVADAGPLTDEKATAPHQPGSQGGHNTSTPANADDGAPW